MNGVPIFFFFEKVLDDLDFWIVLGFLFFGLPETKEAVSESLEI